MVSAATRPTEIGRVRVRSSETGAAEGRSQFAAVIERADLHPAELPPGAILIVRHLETRLPASLPEPFGPGSRSWEEAPRSRLHDLLGRAARPARGVLPADALAVLFADESELLACLLMDVLRGTVGRWWWWQTMNTSDPASQRPAAALSTRLAAVPGALSLLEQWGASGDVLARVSEEEAVVLLDRLAEAFGLARPAALGPDRPTQRSFARPDGAERVGTDGPPGAAVVTQAKSPVSHPTDPAVRDLWARVLGRVVPEELAGPKAVLLATALLLHRSPGAAQSELHAAALARPDLLSAIPTSVGPAAAPSPALERPKERTATRLAKGAGADRLRPSVELGESSIAATVDPDVGVGTVQQRRDPPRTESAVRAPEPKPLDHANPETDLPDLTEADPGLPTELAGVFFLINMMTNLDLLNAFPPEWHLPEAGGWTMLDALARALISDPSLAHDSVWKVLAELEGRPRHEPLGSAVPDGVPFLLPREWWEEPDGVTHWAARQGWLRVWAEEGFVLADTPAAARGPIVALDVLAGYGAAGLTCTRRAFDAAPRASLNSLTDPTSAGLRRWLTLIIPYLRTRLARAFDSDVHLENEVLRRPGVIRASRTHVDIVMDLEMVSLPVRIAGLDHNPGWVPSLGRVITFVYE